MVIYHIDMFILDIDLGYGLMMWEVTVSIWSSSISIYMGYLVTLMAMSGNWCTALGGGSE
jgi:hypothetical protein